MTQIWRILFPLLIILILTLHLAPANAENKSAALATVQSAMDDSTALRGKVVYVDFWASWCVPCRQSFPFMIDLWNRYHDQGLEIIAFNLDTERKSADKFVGELNPPFKIVCDPRGAIAEAYQLEAMPTSFLYDRSGMLRSSYRGFNPKETAKVDSLVKMLLNESVQK